MLVAVLKVAENSKYFTVALRYFSISIISELRDKGAHLSDIFAHNVMKRKSCFVPSQKTREHACLVFSSARVSNNQEVIHAKLFITVKIHVIIFSVKVDEISHLILKLDRNFKIYQRWTQAQLLVKK